MNPNDNYVNPQEYLDQISTKKPGRFNFVDKKIFLLIGAVILLIITIIIWFAMSSAPKQSSASELLAVRLQNMSALLDYDDSKITDDKARKAIAETRIVFASDNYQLSQSLTLSIKPEIAAKEPVSQLVAILDDATSAGRLSQEYLSTLNSQVSQIINSLEEIQLTSNNAAINQTLLDLSELSTRLSRN